MMAVLYQNMENWHKAKKRPGKDLLSFKYYSRSQNINEF